ncbi:hypothetical protein GGF43_005438 [Coemansia sp. RSA 2618]|nr:hypothetical protein GGF43_005438 [Coemansia sp. RSA 2618]
MHLGSGSDYRSGSAMHPGSGSEYRSGSAMSPGPQSRHLLDQGDVLSYVAAAVAAPDTTAFDAQPLNVEALLGAVMQQPAGHSAPSNYRPLSYMPWASRSDSQHSQHSHSGGGYYRGNARPFQSRSRSRGRYGDGDAHRGGYQARHPSRGAHRQQPYARSPGYPGDGRSSQRGHGPRYNDRPNYRGRP